MLYQIEATDRYGRWTPDTYATVANHFATEAEAAALLATLPPVGRAGAPVQYAIVARSTTPGRLGAVERQILLACLPHHRDDRQRPWLDLYRDQLPELLWGWRATTRWTGSRHATTYPDVSRRCYRARQATLTRALRSLYRKGLIDGGNSSEATGVRIYSPVQARALGIAPRAPRTPQEMRQRHRQRDTGRTWSYQSVGEKPRAYRNIRSVRLTVVGVVVATTLAETLNSKTVSAN